MLAGANSEGVAARIAINEPVHAALAYEERYVKKWLPSAVSTFDMNADPDQHPLGVGQTLHGPNTREPLQSRGSMRCCLLLPTAMGRPQAGEPFAVLLLGITPLILQQLVT